MDSIWIVKPPNVLGESVNHWIHICHYAVPVMQPVTALQIIIPAQTRTEKHYYSLLVSL